MQLAPLTVTEIKAADACRIERAPFSCDVAMRPTPRREAGASTSRNKALSECSAVRVREAT